MTKKIVNQSFGGCQFLCSIALLLLYVYIYSIDFTYRTFWWNSKICKQEKGWKIGVDNLVKDFFLFFFFIFFLFENVSEVILENGKKGFRRACKVDYEILSRQADRFVTCLLRCMREAFNVTAENVCYFESSITLS